MMDVLFVLGVIVATFLVDRVGRMKLQTWGFIGCAVGLLLSGLCVRPDGTNNMGLLFLGFTLFYFMVNFGPNAMTYLLAGEVFPPRCGARAPASPRLSPRSARHDGVPVSHPAEKHRDNRVALGSGVCFLAGAAVTYLFRIETTGVNLEDVGKVTAD